MSRYVGRHRARSWRKPTAPYPTPSAAPVRLTPGERDLATSAFARRLRSRSSWATPEWVDEWIGAVT